MHHRILFASVAVFAAQANSLIAATGQPLTLLDASIANDGSIVGCMATDSSRSLNASGTLMEVMVFEGGVKSVEAQLAEAIAINPYVRPLKVLGFKPAPVPASKVEKLAKPKEGETPAVQEPVEEPVKKKKASLSVIIIAGLFQA